MLEYSSVFVLTFQAMSYLGIFCIIVYMCVFVFECNCVCVCHVAHVVFLCVSSKIVLVSMFVVRLVYHIPIKLGLGLLTIRGYPLLPSVRNIFLLLVYLIYLLLMTVLAAEFFTQGRSPNVCPFRRFSSGLYCTDVC